MKDIDAVWAVCKREAEEFNVNYPREARVMVWNLETPRRLVPATLKHGAEVVGKEPNPTVCVRVTFDGPLVDIEHRIDARRVQCLQGSFADVFVAPVVPVDSVDFEAAQARRESFRAAAMPLMTWLAGNANPHAVAHVDSELAELFEGALVVPREL